MKKTLFKKILATSTISLLFIQMMYFVFEPNVSTAASAADVVLVHLDVTQGITISNGANSTMLPNLGVASDRAVGSSSWTVITNSTGGYDLAVTASTNPALIRVSAGDNFADYTEATPGTPDVWGGVTSGTKEFGFSAYGTHVLAKYVGGATDCGNTGTGVPNANSKYEGFTSSTPINIATSSAETPVAGVVTNICFAAQQVGVYAQDGNYQATITGTATAK